MEIELAWGLHDLEDYNGMMESHSKDRKKETEALQEILEVCDKYGIPFSFDIVGHLFYNKCPGDHSGPHIEEWLEPDPGTNVESDPHFYAPDLVSMIRNSKISHEICTHTFSHVPCGEVSKEVADWELKKSKQIHESELDQDLVSFVPPRHSLPSKQVIRKNGIEIIREPADRTETKTKVHTVWRDLFGKHPIKEPKLVEGIVETYSTSGGSLNANHLPDGQQPPHKIYQVIPIPIRQYLHKRYLNNALENVIKQNSHAHFWTHLRDIGNQAQLNTVKWFIEKVSKKRDQREVKVVTMRDLNSQIRKYE